MFPKKPFLLLIVILFVLVAAYLVTMRYYPIAFVGNASILSSEFKKSYLISYNYYLNELKANNQDTVILNSDEIQEELKRATLDMLIEQKIISQELDKRIDGNDLFFMVADKINKINLNSDNFKKGTELLYGASVEDIKKFVLTPKAKEEILDGRLILDNKKIADWLKQKRLEVKVVILMPGFYWVDGAVAIK